MTTRAEKILYSVLYSLLGALWLKLAYDLIFNFGPESARSWFPPYAVVAMSTYSLFLVGLNVYLLVSTFRLQAEPRLTSTNKSLIIAAFLASLFSCTTARTVAKFVDMYFIIPAIILVVASASQDLLARRTRHLLLSLSLLLLIPNDTCENPQNWWWICRIGASPLTYVPPINILLPLTRGTPRRPVLIVILVVVALYYLASVYHRLVGGY